MGSNTKILHKILLQSRSEWLRSELSTHHPANQVENVETLKQYYYTEELSNQILNQLLDEIRSPNQEIVFSLNQSHEQKSGVLMGNQQQTTGGIPQSSQSQEMVKQKTQAMKTLFDIGELLNTPIIGKWEQTYFYTQTFYFALNLLAEDMSLHVKILFLVHIYIQLLLHLHPAWHRQNKRFPMPDSKTI